MTNSKKGFSLLELMIVVAILLIIAAIAIPNLWRSRQRANDAAAVSALRVLIASEASYASTYGQTVGYAGSLAVLGPAATCDQTHACLLDPQLGCAKEPCLRNGYNFYSITDSASPPINDFAFTATPVTWNWSGTSNFCVAEDGVIRFQVDGTASLPGAVAHDKCLNFVLYENI
ncbi:MAG TPA: prepilin-type N-terminal cleavage/methylation domain-containing protein [Candidatus Angelobacter sp.]|nr:prepilin-type N-terminal cleavage/methylation domain-containing protein [Candidatus Angelobacter sp.]